MLSTRHALSRGERGAGWFGAPLSLSLSGCRFLPSPIPRRTVSLMSEHQHTHPLTRRLASTHTHPLLHAQVRPLMGAHTRTHTHAHTHANAHAHAHAHAHTQRRSFFNIVDWYKKNASTPEQLELKRELDQGYWWELKQVGTGKAFQGSLLSKPRQLPTVSTRARTLSGDPVAVNDVLVNEARIPTLVVFSLRRVMCEDMIQTWKRPYQKEFQGKVNILEIVLVDELMYRALGPLWEYAARKTTPKDEWSSVIYSYGDCDKIKDSLNLKNRFLCYPVLLDENGRALWHSSGLANSTDLRSLFACTYGLIGDARRR
eukprot:TRINITY_DN248_c0_g1_i1.p1 TRINITY_DN248_c0_g1~~TRINITY_DN248_c0_g1_i1.p1  ORF type:complete len:315 (-),score=42.35 TRINITY_DN248_c0_g1_i1:39-983(-)